MSEKVMVSFEVDNAGAIKKVKQFKGEMGDVPKSTEKASKGVSRLTKSMGNLAAVVGGAVLVRGIYSSIRAFADFETQAVNVQNITGLSTKSMAALAREVRELPPSLGSATDLMRGLYQTLSSGVPKENAVAFLAENARAAKGNLADLTTTVSASTSVLAAYGLETSETTSVLDAMTKTVDLGKLTFADLANNIGKGISIAAAAGVTYKELMATMAALTLSGLSVEEAMTGIRNILSITMKMKPGEGMAKFGVEMSAAAIKAQGFAGYMGTVAEAVEGNDEAIVAMFGNLRAMGAAMSLVSEQGGERFNNILGEIAGSAGKVDENFERMSNTINAKTAELSAQFELLKISFAENAAPALIQSLQKITDGLVLMVDLLSFKESNNLAGFTTQLEAMDRGAVALARSLKESYGSVGEGVQELTGHTEAGLNYLVLYLREQEKWNRLTEEEARLLKIMNGAQAEFIMSQQKAKKATEDAAAALTVSNKVVVEAAAAISFLTEEHKEWLKELELSNKSVIKAGEGFYALRDSYIEAGGGVKDFGGQVVNTGQDFTNVMWTMEDELKAFFNAGNVGFPKLGKDAEDATATIQTSFTDLISKGFTGELESFADIWENIWADLAKSMVTILGGAIEAAFRGGGNIFENIVEAWKNIKAAIEENAVAAGISGAGGVYAGYQQGGVGGFLQGAMGGASLGGAIGAIGGPAGIGLGMGIGAAAGGLMSLFGGEDEPQVYGSLGLGGHQVFQSDTDLTTGERAVWAQQRIEEYRNSIMGMNDILRMFSDGDLFGLIGDAPDFEFNEADLGAITTIFSERWLPQAMRQMFRNAINRGLRGFGVDDATRQQLWSELRGLGADQIAGLETYIGALVGTTHLLDDMDWNAILDETRMDSLSAFLGGMGDTLEAVQAQMFGLDSMTLLERAGQADTIEQLIIQARGAEIAMLRQIDQLQNSINDSISNQIEGIRVGGMSDTQAANYYAQQIADIMDQMRAGITSPEMAQQLAADLQRYIGAYAGVLGDDIYSTTTGGVSLADHLVNILEEARGLSNDALEAMRDQIQASNDALITELQRLIEALTNFTGQVTGADVGGAQGKALDVSGQFDIRVHPTEELWAQVDARIEQKWAEKTYAGPN